MAPFSSLKMILGRDCELPTTVPAYNLNNKFKILNKTSHTTTLPQVTIRALTKLWTFFCSRYPCSIASIVQPKQRTGASRGLQFSKYIWKCLETAYLHCIQNDCNNLKKNEFFPCSYSFLCILPNFFFPQYPESSACDVNYMGSFLIQCIHLDIK